MTGIGAVRAGASNDATRRYEDAKARLGELEAQPRYDGVWDAVTPHDTDGWLLRGLKVGLPAAAGVALLGGALTLAGRPDAGMTLMRGAAVAGVTGLFGGFMAGMVHLQAGGDPFVKDTPEIAKQREAVNDLLQQTPEWSSTYEQSFEDVANEQVIPLYDHDGDGTLAIGPAATARADERVRSTYDDGGPVGSGDSKVRTAYTTFREHDANGDQKLTAEELGGWLQAFDENGTGRLSAVERSRATLTERTFDQYAEFVDSVAAQP